MQGQTKIIRLGTVLIVYAIQNGVLSQGPSPFGCYEDIMEVGRIFCRITGQKGLMNIFWPDLVIICTDAYLNLSIPFKVKGDEIVTCPDKLQEKFDEWKKRWSENEVAARKDLCHRTDRG
uniref:Putative salivary secreted protein n=1 Tax=Ixodes ricinus TaxID=34613 RepID=A0A6B0UMM4_IXORI